MIVIITSEEYNECILYALCHVPQPQEPRRRKHERLDRDRRAWFARAVSGDVDCRQVRGRHERWEIYEGKALRGF